MIQLKKVTDKELIQRFEEEHPPPDKVEDPIQAKELGDKASTIARHWRKKSGGWKPLEDMNRATEAAILYYRRAGELLREMPKQHGARGVGKKVEFQEGTPLTLADLSLTKKHSHRFQLMAEVSEEEIRKMRASASKARAELTQDKIYRRGSELRRERLRDEAARRGAKSPKETEQYELIHGDCLEACSAMEADSVDVIITDPPYGKNAAEYYDRLGQAAKHVLKPGRCCFAFAGQYSLGPTLEALGKHLTYHWTIAYIMPGGHATRIRNREINAYWKPIVWFAKGEHKSSWITDVISTSTNQGGDVFDTNKQFHVWGQNVEGIITLVTRVTRASQTILDPFCGAGAIGVAAITTGRGYIGIDKVKKNINICAARLEKTQQATNHENEGHGKKTNA